MGLSNEEIWTMRNVLWYKITFLDKFVFSLLFFPFEALIRVSTDSLFSCLRESLRMQYVNFILKAFKKEFMLISYSSELVWHLAHSVNVFALIPPIFSICFF